MTPDLPIKHAAMWLLFLSVWMSIPTPVFSQTLTFDILYGERHVGELTATLTRNGTREVYEGKTVVRANLIKKIEVQYLGKAVFENGVLVESKVKSLLNGDVFADAETKKVGQDYQFFEDGKLKHTVKGPIKYSVLQMHFSEPLGITSVYSEEAGLMQAISAGGKGAYDKVNNRGRTNRYHYINRDLQKIQFDAGIVEFEMKRKK